MVFKNKIGEYAELKVLEPSSSTYDPETDSEEWLRIYLKVSCRLGNWEVVDPCLMDVEIAQLADWFGRLAKNEPVQYTWLHFTEPNLVWELLEDDPGWKKIQIRFNAECRPKTRKFDKYYIDFEWDSSDLFAIQYGLLDELSSLNKDT